MTTLRNVLLGAPRLAQPGADSSDKSPLDLFLPSLVPTLANTPIGSYFAWGGREGPSIIKVTANNECLCHGNFAYVFKNKSESLFPLYEEGLCSAAHVTLGRKLMYLDYFRGLLEHWDAVSRSRQELEG